MAHRALRLGDDRVLVVGGSTSFEADALANDAWLFDPATNRWISIEGPDGLRAGHQLTLLADGSVLVTGERADGTAVGLVFTP